MARTYLRGGPLSTVVAPHEYGLGVDLGTTRTAAAVLVDGRVEVVQLGGHRDEIPSLVFVRADGEILIGDAAERRGASEPERLAREFKRRVGDQVKIMIGGAEYSAPTLMALLLHEVLETVTRQQERAPGTVTLTHPANWTAFKRDRLAEAFRATGLDNITFRSEPEAAAVQYAAGEKIRPDEIVAVYDLGGGTFDAAVLRKTPTGFELLGEPKGLDDLGGGDFDEEVYAHVTAALDGAIGRLDPDDEPVIEALARLRGDCVAAKEALSFDTDVMIPVALPGLHTRVRLNRSEFEARIAPRLDETVEALRGAMRSAAVTPAELKCVLLAGGSARIPLVGQLLATALDRPTVLDPHPEHSVALGAALLTAPPPASSVESAAPVQATVPPVTVPPVTVPPATVPPVTVPPVTVPPAPAGFVVGRAAVPAGVDTASSIGRFDTPRAEHDSGDRPGEHADGDAARGGRRGRWTEAVEWLRTVPARVPRRYRWLAAATAALVVVAVAAAGPGWNTGGDADAHHCSSTSSTAAMVLWSVDCGSAVTGLPALAGNTVYFGSRGGHVYALDRHNGRTRWDFRATGPVVASPQVLDGVLYTASQDGFVYALDADQGSLRWKRAIGAGADSTSSPTVADGVLYIGGSDRALHAFDLSGRQKWQFDSGGVIAATPAVAAGVVYAGSQDGHLYAIDGATGHQRWAAQIGESYSSPSVAAGIVFVSSGDTNLYALDAATGRVLWTLHTGYRAGMASLVVDGTVYLGGADGLVRQLDAVTGRQHWHFDTTGVVESAPALADGMLYVGSDSGRVYALDAKNGRARWDFPTNGHVTGSPRVADGVLYVGSDDHRMYALRLPPPSPSSTTPSPSPADAAPPPVVGNQPRARPQWTATSPSPVETSAPAVSTPWRTPGPSPPLDG